MSDSTNVTNQTWRISSTAGEFFDEDFLTSPNSKGPMLLATSAAEALSPPLGSPSTASHRDPKTTLATATTPKGSPGKTTGTGKIASAAAESEREQRLARLRSQQHDLFIEQQRLEAVFNQQSKDSMHFPNPPLRSGAKQSTSSYMSSSSSSPMNAVTAPNTPSQPQIRQPQDKQHSPVDAGALSQDTSNDDTDMQDRSSGSGSGSNSGPEESSPYSGSGRERNMKTVTSPSQTLWANQASTAGTTTNDFRSSSNSTPTKFESRMRAVSSGKGMSPRQRHGPPPFPPPQSPPSSAAHHAGQQLRERDRGSFAEQGSAQRSPTDMANDFEISALRAQVAQLQFALKKQMSTTGMNIAAAGGQSGNIPSRLLNEITGLPTPEESIAGSTLSAINRPHPRQQGSLLSAGSGGGDRGMNYEMQNDRQRDLARGSSQRFSSNDQAPTLGRPAFMASRETFGMGGNGSSDIGTQRSLWESASAFVRPDENRVDELSAKLDRLEELFRLTALQQQQRGHGEETHSPKRSASPYHVMHPSMRDHYDGSVYSGTAKMSQQTSNYSNNSSYYHQGSTAGPMRAPSMGGSAYGSQYGSQLGSVRTKSPAASAFHYNATPYDRYLAQGGGSNADFTTGVSANTSLPSSNSGGAASFDGQSFEGQYVGVISSNASHHSGGGASGFSRGPSGYRTGVPSSSAHIEHHRRKGVARFILGTTASKVIDPVQSHQVSLSFNRTERVEKPLNTKMKAAGRGRVVVVEKKAKQ